MRTSERADAGAVDRGPEPFDALFQRAYPAVIGIVVRIIDRDLTSADALRVGRDVATDVLTVARSKHLDDTDESVTRVVSWAADRCLGLLDGLETRVPLPPGITAADLADADVLAEGAGLEWTVEGMALEELRIALRDLPARVRRVGLLCLGAGLSLEDTAALLDLRGDEATSALAEVGERMCVRRRTERGVVTLVERAGEW